MTQYALVRDGEIVEYKDYAGPIDDQSRLSPNKAKLFRVVEVGNSHGDGEALDGPVITLDHKKLLAVFTYKARPLTGEEVQAIRDAKIGQIKAEAASRIGVVMPDYQQRNSLALCCEMITTVGPDPADWPKSVRIAYDQAMEKWKQIKAIRLASNIKEGEVATLSSPAKIEAYDASLGW